MQASVAHIQQRIPILRSTWLCCGVRVRSQAGLYRLRITEHEFSKEVGMCDPLVQRQQPESAVFGASSRTANEFVDSGGE